MRCVKRELSTVFTLLKPVRTADVFDDGRQKHQPFGPSSVQTVQPLYVIWSGSRNVAATSGPLLLRYWTLGTRRQLPAATSIL